MMKHAALSVSLTIHDGEEQQANDCCWLSLTPDGLGDSQYFLPNSGTFLTDFCRRMLEQDFVVRFDQPGKEFASYSTTVVRSITELDVAIRLLSADAQSDRLYPLSVWILPRSKSAAATEFIEAFQLDRGDTKLFDGVLRLGGMRLAVWKSFFDLNIGCRAFEWSVDIVIQSAQSMPGKLVWEYFTSAEFRARHPMLK